MMYGILTVLAFSVMGIVWLWWNNRHPIPAPVKTPRVTHPDCLVPTPPSTDLIPVEIVRGINFITGHKDWRVVTTTSPRNWCVQRFPTKWEAEKWVRSSTIYIEMVW